MKTNLRTLTLGALLIAISFAFATAQDDDNLENGGKYEDAWVCYEDEGVGETCVTAEFYKTFWGKLVELQEQEGEGSMDKVAAMVDAGEASIPNVAIVVTPTTAMNYIPGITEADYPGVVVHRGGTPVAHYHLPRKPE